MKIMGNSLEKGFLVKYKGKNYQVNYFNADYSSPRLLNRDYWEVIDESGEEVSPYVFKSSKNKKEAILYYLIIDFCIKNFNLYEPKL